ncbi:MAG TPA: cytochrome c [Candidatus Methylacidiphilales bacterium]|jgi:mono/diheme cytochrome c family protein|nr:cytochrome c [Candidatus Methylacidiphilales bacterium]
MSHQNPQVESPPQPSGNDAIQPNAPDFIETPEVAPLSAEREPLPLWLYLFCGFLLFMVGSSFTGFGIFGRGLLDQGPGGPAMASASQAGPEAPLTPAQLGKTIYAGNCANCHQKTGAGQPGKYPPLVASEWVCGSKERLAAILLKGVQGPITVTGSTFGTDVMPAQEAVLTPEKIADLMTYIRSDWGNTANAVSVDEVNAVKAKYTSRTTAWTEPELLKIAPNGPDPSDKKP